MAGKVQMVYIDPPYGIRYGSNFQPFVNKRDVKDGSDEDLTQEPEMIRAFRDTWELGIHSYLTYLRDRLLLARELLHESGSCFVQISRRERPSRAEPDGRGVRQPRTSASIRSFVKKNGGLEQSGTDASSSPTTSSGTPDPVQSRQVPPALSVENDAGSTGVEDVELTDGRAFEYRAVLPRGERRRRALNRTLSGPARSCAISEQPDSAAFRPKRTVRLQVRRVSLRPRPSLEDDQCRRTSIARLDAGVAACDRHWQLRCGYVRYLDDFPVHAAHERLG